MWYFPMSLQHCSTKRLYQKVFGHSILGILEDYIIEDCNPVSKVMYLIYIYLAIIVAIMPHTSLFLGGDLTSTHPAFCIGHVLQ